MGHVMHQHRHNYCRGISFCHLSQELYFDKIIIPKENFEPKETEQLRLLHQITRVSVWKWFKRNLSYLTFSLLFISPLSFLANLLHAKNSLIIRNYLSDIARTWHVVPLTVARMSITVARMSITVSRSVEVTAPLQFHTLPTKVMNIIHADSNGLYIHAFPFLTISAVYLLGWRARNRSLQNLASIFCVVVAH